MIYLLKAVLRIQGILLLDTEWMSLIKGVFRMVDNAIQIQSLH